jgi:hypothetical protein
LKVKVGVFVSARALSATASASGAMVAEIAVTAPAAQEVAPAVARGDDLAHRRIGAWVRGLVLGLLGRLRTGQQLLHGRFSGLSSHYSRAVAFR